MVMKPVSVNASSESGDLSLEDKYYQILASQFAKAPLFSNNIGESKLYSSDFLYLIPWLQKLLLN